MIINQWNTVIEKRPYIPGFLVILFVFIVYIPALNIYLIRDDFEWLNQSYGAWENPSILFQLINNFFRPMVKLFYLLNYTFFKTHVPFYNLTTILFHLANVFLLYILIFKLTRKTHIAVLTALIFGTSPMYSEVTLWSASRMEAILLMFIMGVLLYFYNYEKKKSWLQQTVIVLLTLCALGTKETWVLLPFLALSFLLVVKQIPLRTALKATSPLFILLTVYIGYFIGLPFLSGTSPPSSYANLDIGAAIKKFGFLIFRYVDLGDSFTAAYWQYLLIITCLLGVGYWSIRRKNRLALWGMIWMFMCMAISLPIYYAPSRYNYLPLVGFWMTAISFLSVEIESLVRRFKINRSLVCSVIGSIFFFLISYNVIMLQWEIKDYRNQSVPHRTVVDMYRVVKDQLPRGEPIVFIDISTRKAVDESSRSVEGYRKLLYVRERAIWQMVYISPLANFTGDPFDEVMEPIPERELDAVFQGEFTVLVFTDAAFYISDTRKPGIRDFYQRHRKLPYKVEAVRFIPVKKRNQTI